MLCFVVLLALVISFGRAEDWSWGGTQVSADGSTIYAYQYRNGGRVFQSRDRGRTFQVLDDDKASGYWGVGGIDANGTTILLGSTNAGGIIKSLDGGQVWNDVQSLPRYSDQHMYSAIGISDDGKEMYVGASNSGPLFRKRGNDNWEKVKIPNKIPRNAITCFSIDMSEDGQNVYIADFDTASEILVSPNHGDTWSTIQVTDDSELYPQSIAVAKENKNVMAIGFSDFELENGALFVSTDAGQTFSDVTAQTGALPFEDLSISSDGRYVLASTMNLWGTDSTPPEKRGRLFLSTDQGSTWKTIEVSKSVTQGFTGLSMSRDGNTMIAIGSSRDHTYMFISNDYGVSWANANDRCHY